MVLKIFDSKIALKNGFINVSNYFLLDRASNSVACKTLEAETNIVNFDIKSFKLKSKS